LLRTTSWRLTQVGLEVSKVCNLPQGGQDFELNVGGGAATAMVMEAILEKTSEVTHMVMMLVVTSVHAGIYIVGQSWVSWSFLRWWSSWSLDQLHGETAG